MESRFSKYKSEKKEASNQIANINNYIDWNYSKGLDMIEKEINSLQSLIEGGRDNKMFPMKINQLIALGECIEKIHEIYHFGKDNTES
jgi:hypothetical protein